MRSLSQSLSRALAATLPALRLLKRLELGLLILILLSACLYLHLSPLRFYNLTVEDSLFPNRGEISTRNNYRPQGRGAEGRILKHRAEFDYNWISQETLHIRTLDCAQSLKINGVELELRPLSGHVCDDYNGAYFDISEYIVPGKNTLEAQSLHRNPEHIVYFGFLLRSANLKDPLYFAICCLAVAIAFYLLFTRLLRSSLPAYALFMLLSVVLLRIYLVSNTHALERSHDVYGHLEYMNIMIAERSLPASDRCWSCYHPPLYFAIAALAKGLLGEAGLTDFSAFQWMMLASVAMHSIALYFAFLTIHRIIRSTLCRILAMGLFSTLPASAAHSVAINNDQWMFAFAIMAIYYFVLWWQIDKTRFYYISLLLAAASVVTKPNGIVIFALLGFFALGRSAARYKEAPLMVARFAPALGIMLAALAVNPSLDRLLRPASINQGSPSIIQNAGGLSAQLKLQNQVANYLSFDPVSFVSKPYVHPLIDETGRQYFWTALAKTAMYGEYRDLYLHHDGKGFRNVIAPIGNALFLILTVFTIVHALLASKETLNRLAPLYGLAVLSVAALLFIRIYLPYFPMNDFRYIWPAMIAPCILAPIAVEAARKCKLPALSALGQCSLALFILSNFAFILLMR